MNAGNTFAITELLIPKVGEHGIWSIILTEANYNKLSGCWSTWSSSGAEEITQSGDARPPPN